MVTIIQATVFFMFCAALLPAQSTVRDFKEDISFIRNPGDAGAGNAFAARKTTDPGAAADTNDLKIVMGLLVKGYQVFISSQDKPSCPFQPTCSEFAKQAIERYGPVLGLIMATGRLQRCNGMGKGYYPVAAGTGRFDDPIERNSLTAGDITYLKKDPGLH